MIQRTHDNRFEIKRVVNIDNDDPTQFEKLKYIRSMLGYDVLIKDEKNGLYFLCNEITDAHLVLEEASKELVE